MSLNFEGCGWVRRWNPAACSTSLGSHVPTPRTFQLPGWEVAAAASSYPSGPGLGGAGLSWGSLRGGGDAAGSGQRTQRALTEGRTVPMGKALPFLPRSASHHFSRDFAHQLSHSRERRLRRRAKGPQKRPQESSPLGIETH